MYGIGVYVFTGYMYVVHDEIMKLNTHLETTENDQMLEQEWRHTPTTGCHDRFTFATVNRPPGCLRRTDPKPAPNVKRQNGAVECNGRRLPCWVLGSGAGGH